MTIHSELEQLSYLICFHLTLGAFQHLRASKQDLADSRSSTQTHHQFRVTLLQSFPEQALPNTSKHIKTYLRTPTPY